MMANVITGLRILVSAVLLFCPVFSPIFYVLYLIAGLSDMADGIVARKTNSVSEFGSRLDGVADFVFAAVQEGHFIRTGKGIKQKIVPTESGG